MISAVFDTNIYLQAILSETGPASACVEELFAGRIEVLVHPEILAEIDDFLLRPRVRSKYGQVRSVRTVDLVRKISKYGRWVPSVESVVKLDRDPSDSIFLNLAITYDVDYLVSRDNDLLQLSEGKTLEINYPNLKIVAPYRFLQAVRSGS